LLQRKTLPIEAILWLRTRPFASSKDGPDEAMARSRKASFFVAVVDDDAGVRAAIESLLHSTGLRTRGFASAEAFLRCKEHAAAGCLILDMRLPGMSGLELHLQLQASGLGIPTIFVTAESNNDEGLRAQIERAGATAVLPKPCDSEELTRLVQAALDARRPR
jgi:FixJ family two-component response regulator